MDILFFISNSYFHQIVQFVHTVLKIIYPTKGMAYTLIDITVCFIGAVELLIDLKSKFSSQAE